MGTPSTGVRFFVAGEQLVKKTFDELGDSGKKMWAGIASGQDRALPGMRALSNGVNELKGGMENLIERAGPVGSILSGLGPAGIAAAVGIGAAVAAIGILYEKVRAGEEMATTLTDQARALNLSVTAFQQLQYAAKQSDVPVETLAGSIRDLNKASDEFVAGVSRGGSTSGIGAAFGYLGITREQLAQVTDAKDRLELFSEAYLKFEQAHGVSAAHGLADRLGFSDLVPLLEKGRDGIRALSADAVRTNQVLGDGIVAPLHEAGREAGALETSISNNLTTAFAGAAEPVNGLLRLVNLISSALAKWPALVGGFSGAAKAALDLLFPGGGLISTVLSWFGGGSQDASKPGASGAPRRNGSPGQITLPPTREDLARTENFDRQTLAIEQQRLQAEQRGAKTAEERADLGRQLADIEKKLRDKAIDDQVASGGLTKQQGDRLKALEEAAAAAQADATGNILDKDAAKTTKQGLERLKRFQDAIRAAGERQLAASDDDTKSIEDRLAIELRRLDVARDAEKEELARQVKAGELTAAQAAQIDTAQQAAHDAQAEAAERKARHERFQASVKDDEEFATFGLEVLRAQEGIAVTLKARNDLQLRIFDAERAQERAALAARDAADPNVSAAQAAAHLSAFDQVTSAQRGGLVDQQAALSQAVHDAFTQGVHDAFAEGGGPFAFLRGFFESLATYFAQKLETELADNLYDVFGTMLKSLLTELFQGQGGASTGSSILSAIGSGFNWLFGGGHAAGGPMQSGYYYNVAEHGAELAVFGRAGQVFNAGDTAKLLTDATGGGGGVTVHATFAPTYAPINGSGPEIADLRRQIAEDKANFKANVTSAVNDAVDRGGIVASRIRGNR